jgi:hypothetical protein
VPLASAWNRPAHREIHAALAVGGEVVDHAAEAIERIAVRHLVGEDPPLRRQLRHVRVQTALDDEQLALLVHRERASRVRVSVDRFGLAAAVQPDHGRIVVLRDQEIAVLVRQDAVGVVAADLPHLGPLLTRGNDAGNGGDGVVGRRRREGGWRCGRCAARAAGPAGSLWGRRWRHLARGNQRLVAGILRRLRACARGQRGLPERDAGHEHEWKGQENAWLHKLLMRQRPAPASVAPAARRRLARARTITPREPLRYFAGVRGMAPSKSPPARRTSP